MSELRTNRIVPRDGLPSGSAGGIIQVVFTSLATGSTVTVNSSSFVDVMSASITPTRSDSKILVQVTSSPKTKPDTKIILSDLDRVIVQFNCDIVTLIPVCPLA